MNGYAVGAMVRRHPVAAVLGRSPALLVAAALAGAWLVAAPRTPDLAAQVYRAGVFAREGYAVWDGNWYGGHHLLGYSLLFPPLAFVLGVRLAGALAAVASAVLFERLARAHFGERRARLGAIWFGAAAATDLLIGRLTYGLGAAVALGALLALQRDRRNLAVLLAAACAAASPVAGAFLALAGAALVLAERAPRGLRVALPAIAVAGALSIAFPEGGREPFSFGAFAAVLACAAVVWMLCGRDERVLRAGAALYALAALACFVVPTPMGSNVTRLGAVLAGPLVLCTVKAHRPALPALRALAVVGLAGLGAWQWYAPVREVGKVTTDPSTGGAYYAGLSAFLRAHVGTADGGRARHAVARVEVPFTRGHWEAAFLAPRFALARGWEAQLDTKYDALFYDRSRPLSGPRYAHWLARNGVRYVALPDVALDPSARAEARLIRSRPAFLTPVWADPHWRVFRVRGARGLVAGPGRLTALGPASFAVQARRPGRLLVRVRFTPYWRVRSGRACVAPAAGGWTRVFAARPGPITVRASITAAGLLRQDPQCSRFPAATGPPG